MGSSKSAPVALGVQSAMLAPLGTYTNAMRRGNALGSVAAARSRADGAMASNMGSATRVPNPRRKVRLGICHF